MRKFGPEREEDFIIRSFITEHLDLRGRKTSQ
jgi:hypothetical protein